MGELLMAMIQEDEKMIMQELDLLKTNGGVDFEPKGAEVVKNKSGDPRWYK